MQSMFRSAVNVTLLAMESQEAAQLRLYRLGLGGPAAAEESMLMIEEKFEAFGRAMMSYVTGGSFDSVVGDYQSVVQANVRRLRTDDAVEAAV